MREARTESGDETDVVVVGFGAAGACAALEASDAGADVVVLDRFSGGGATKLSAGIVYAGGGSPQQRQAGYDDDADEMFAYLRREVGETIGDGRLRRFCVESLQNIEWLERNGVGFPDGFFKGKTSVPPDDFGLYFSGNEKQFGPVPRPAPRGHRVDGSGLTGDVLFAALRRAVSRRRIDVRKNTRVTDLATDADGAVVGVVATTLAGRPVALAMRWLLYVLAAGIAGARTPGLERVLAWIAHVEERYGRTYTLKARNGVVLCTGGFSFNRDMVRAHAAPFAPCMPIGTPGDDGAAIRIGRSVGAATASLDRCAASRFLTPPEAFVEGVLVNGAGERICDESQYGSTLGSHIAEQEDGQAWLVIDAGIWRRAREECREDESLWEQPLVRLLSGRRNHVIFRKMNGFGNLYLNRRKADTVEGLARKLRMRPDLLDRTLAQYNENIRRGDRDPLGKPAEFCATLDEGPFYAIDCSLGSALFIAPFLTLGGLVIDESSGQVLREDSTPIPGLYAAGRAAVGITSHSYVSGLSLADCVFSGRNVGRHLATMPNAV